MNLRIIFVLIALPSSLSIAAGNTIFYAGDTQSDSTTGPNSFLLGKTYEVFEVTETVRIHGLFANQLAFGPPEPVATYELYKNPSTTSLGQFVASGQAVGTGIPTGRVVFGFVETRVEIEIPELVISPGRYAFNMRTNGAESIGSTTGLNGIGPTAGDDFSYYTDNVGGNLQTRSRSYSMGVVGQPVPEPASLTGLALGAFVLFQRARRPERASFNQ